MDRQSERSRIEMETIKILMSSAFVEPGCKLTVTGVDFFFNLVPTTDRGNSLCCRIYNFLNIMEDEIEKGKSVNNIEKIKNTKFYRGICCKYDKGFVSFLVQVSLAFTVMALCVAKLAIGVSADERTIYISLISGILGYFLPNPKIKSSPPTGTSGTYS